MGPDERDEEVSRILKTGVGLTNSNFYTLSAMLWEHRGTCFAEVRVFVHRVTPELQFTIDTICVEASFDEHAISLLETQLEERYGPVTWVRWSESATE